MKLKQKITTVAAGLVSLTSTVVASPGHDEGTTADTVMMDGTWMHSGADMMGYNMWGMGWFGALFGLAFWTLVILGIIFLFQQVTENSEEGQNE